MQYDARIIDVLDNLEKELKILDYWQIETPEDTKLESVVPFCYDTLRFTEWLQWVFIPRLRLMISQEQGLPAKSEILPVAELYFDQQNLPAGNLLALIGVLDDLMPDPITN